MYGQKIVLLLFFISVSVIISVLSVEPTSKSADCKVCTRVLRGARDSAKQNQIGVVEALEDYCKLQNINVEDQKFCYNIDTMKSDINRLLRLGADDDRICKKVKAVNPHFCLSKTAKSEDTTAAYVPSRTKRGIIYI